jgi:acetoin utilization deacetylase AcuC-like enzyme
MFVSLHGDPSVSYPYYSGFRDERGAGAGQGFNLNYPLAKNTGWATYKEALLDACNQLRNFSPQVLVISLGVDTFKDDPISHFLLESRDFLGIGEIIASVGVPTLFVMEGGYMVDEIGINAVNVLHGFENKHA